jgi:hypothetical protein
MRILKASVLYFGIVFACGLVLGTIRTFWLAPRMGTRSAELLETPLMLLVSALAARWTVVRLTIPSARSARLIMGGFALALLLSAEFGFVLWIRRLSIKDYLAARDPVSGTAYYAALGIFAILPLAMQRKTLGTSDRPNQ